MVWADIDSPGALGGLSWLAEQGLSPSAVIASGRGFWFYWKLATLTPTPQIEVFNRRLNVLLSDHIGGADPASTNCDRIARLPGTVHEDTGVISHFVLPHCPWGTYAVGDLDRL